MTYSQLAKEALYKMKESLEAGWQAYFKPRRAGKHIGLEIVCPACQERPPITVKPWQRWRWLAVHNAVKHTGGFNVGQDNQIRGRNRNEKRAR